MSNNNFTRINTFMPDALNGHYCFQRFDVPTQALAAAFNAHFSGATQPHAEHWQRMVMTDKPGLTVANLPVSAPMHAFFSEDKKYANMLGRLDDAGLLVPVNTNPSVLRSGSVGKPSALSAKTGVTA